MRPSGPLALAILLAAVSGAQAQDASGCDKFRWSVARERGWIAAGPKPVKAGASEPIAPTAYRLTLLPTESAGFAATPERAPKAGTYGGTLVVTGLGAAGLYEVTLSDEGWIDVIQNGARVKSSDFSGQKGCPGVRKTVRFPLQAGTAVLQVSNMDSATATIAIAAAE
jgi:hypothetical protein